MAGAFEQVRGLLERFARAHEPCCRSSAIGGGAPHRCSACGLLLLFGDRCPGHPSTERLSWHKDLEAALGEELAARRRGEQVAIPAGPAGDMAFSAQYHMRRPGWAWLVGVA